MLLRRLTKSAKLFREQQPLYNKFELLVLFNPLTELRASRTQNDPIHTHSSSSVWFGDQVDTTFAMRVWMDERAVRSSSSTRFTYLRRVP